MQPRTALETLLAGNARFVSGERLHPHQDADRRAAVAPAQKPFAVLFGCSDSRLAAEIIFDQGLGDLFVIRTAGHVVGPEVLGSIEYAVAFLDVSLIAVLGHDSCGAIGAALDSWRTGDHPTGYIRDVVERTTLGILPVREEALKDPEVAVEEHIRYTVEMLEERSPLLAARVSQGRLGLAGLRYRLAEGGVRQVALRGLAD
jgi:carbonic anhydrase